MKNTETVLSKKQIKLSRLIIGAVSVLAGVFLLLAGLGVFPFTFKQAVLPALLIAAGLTLFALGFVQQNTLLLWLAFPFLTAALVTVLASATTMGYSKLYPIYIFAPAIASLVTAIYDGVWRTHLKIIIPFAAPGILFSLNTFFLVQWKILLPSFVILLGVSAIMYALKK